MMKMYYSMCNVWLMNATACTTACKAHAAITIVVQYHQPAPITTAIQHTVKLHRELHTVGAVGLEVQLL